MKIVLLQDVPGLGQAGQVKEVADGYGRNYLLPRRLAELATAAALSQVEQLKAKAVRARARVEADLRELGQLLEGMEVTIRARAGAEGKLFGSVTSAQIAEELSRQMGRPIDRHQVLLEDPLRQLGSHPVQVRLGADVTPTITVAVEAEA
ncbi:MAG: 50S ribosomal protein L9 [Chloroflexi bacterium]|nr:50S ribosomal protein L9 [Chloroflexota bacterium]